MTAPELKPCPFCGGEAEIWRAHEGRTAWIACMGKCVVLISKEYLSDDDAIAAWNRRADLAAVQPAQVLDLIPRMDAIQACNVGPSDEWSKSTKSGYEQAATDCQRNILRIKPAAAEPQPDPRNEVIKGLVEALEFYADEDTYETQYERMPCDCCTDIFEPINDDKGLKARAALAAAKAVLK